MGIRRIWRSSKSQHGHRETPPRVVLQHTLCLADEVGSPGRLPRPWNSQVETCRQPPAMDGHEFFLEGERRSHQAPARRTWLAPKARQAPKHTPPCPPHLLPRPSLSIQPLVFVRRCRCRSFQEHTLDRKINKNRHHQSRRPTTPPLRRRTAGGNGRALLPWRWQSGLSRVIAIQEWSETTTCSAAAAQHAICGRPMWPSNLVCSAALRYKTGPRYLRCGKRQLVRGAPPSAYHVVRLQPHLCCRTPTWYLQRKSVYADGDSS